MDLGQLFRRDLMRLSKQLQAVPNDDLLWKLVPGPVNPIGVLVLHLEGNLREYTGRQLGQHPYKRQREAEFTAALLTKKELIARTEELLC